MAGSELYCGSGDNSLVATYLTGTGILIMNLDNYSAGTRLIPNLRC